MYRCGWIVSCSDKKKSKIILANANATSKQVQGFELQPRVKLCLGVKQGLANFEPKTCLGALLSAKQGFCLVLSKF